MKAYLSILLAIILILTLSALVSLLYVSYQANSEKSIQITRLYDAELTTKRAIVETAKVASFEAFSEYNSTHKKAFCRHCKPTCREPCEFEKLDPELYSTCMAEHELTKYSRKGIDNFCESSFCNECFLDECAKEISAYSASNSVYSLISAHPITDFEINNSQTKPTPSILYLSCDVLGENSLWSLPKHSTLVPYGIKSEIDNGILRLKFDKGLDLEISSFFGLTGETKIPKNYPILETEMGQ